MGWLCTKWETGTQLVVSTLTKYSWTSNITMVAGTLIDTWSIQADFDPATGQLLSEKGTPTKVPEPATLALFGLGLTVMGFARRRKRT